MLYFSFIIPVSYINTVQLVSECWRDVGLVTGGCLQYQVIFQSSDNSAIPQEPELGKVQGLGLEESLGLEDLWLMKPLGLEALWLKEPYGLEVLWLTEPLGLEVL